MPQTSDDHRARWPGWDTEAIAHLEGRGYVQTKDGTWQWIKPEGLTPSERDLDAIDFLVMEFDWGGLKS
jgi:hypothetical protein